MVGRRQRTEVGMDFLNDGNSGEKSLQRDAIVGRWGGHTLNLGGSAGWLRSISVVCIRMAAGDFDF